MILEELTEEFGEYLPGAFESVIGAIKSDLIQCFNDRSKLIQYKEAGIHFEGGFEKIGRVVQLVVVGFPYGKTRITLTGNLKYRKKDVNGSKYLRTRKIEEQERKARFSCKLKKMPKTGQERQELYQECFEYIVRESIRLARTTE